MYHGIRPSSEVVRAHLRDHLGRSNEARHVHRLLCLLLVAQGAPVEEVSRRMDVSSRSIERWLRLCSVRGVEALLEKPKPGRPPSLTASQLKILKEQVGDAGKPGGIGSGRDLADLIRHQFGRTIGERQARRVLAELRRS